MKSSALLTAQANLAEKETYGWWRPTGAKPATVLHSAPNYNGNSG